MAITNGPNLGLMVQGELGETHYTQFMKFLRGVDALVQPVASAIANSPPGSPTDGLVVLVDSAPTGAFSGHASEIARYNAALGANTWEFFAPHEGWRISVGTTRYEFDGVGTWAEVTSGGGGTTGPSKFSTAASAAGALDLSDATVAVWKVTLTENVTAITLPTATGDEAFGIMVLFEQDATGGRTVTGWPTIAWPDGTEPTIDGTAGNTTSVPLLLLGDGSAYGV